jgi:hypothetical protein
VRDTPVDNPNQLNLLHLFTRYFFGMPNRLYQLRLSPRWLRTLDSANKFLCFPIHFLNLMALREADKGSHFEVIYFPVFHFRVRFSTASPPVFRAVLVVRELV